MWNLLLRDWRELLGDTKYLIITIGVPLLITPLMIVGIAAMGTVKAEAEAARVYQYTLLESPAFAELEQALEASPRFERATLEPGRPYREAVNEGDLDLALQVERDTERAYRLRVFHRETSPHSEMLTVLRQTVEQVSNTLRANYFEELGISGDLGEQILTPVVLNEHQIQEEREFFGEFLGLMVNFVIVIWMFSTAMSIAGDIVTGEKERSTLETLLISPLSRRSILLGKWLTLASACVMTVTLILVVYYLSLMIIQSAMPSGFINAIMENLAVADVLQLWLLLLPQCLIVGGTLLLTSISAKTLKDAQSSGSVLLILLMAPMLMQSIGTIEWNEITQWLPMVNLTLANAEVLKGTLSVWVLPALVISNGALLAVLYALVARQFRSERVLFG